MERQNLQVDISCVGLGPSVAGFLTTLTDAMAADPAAEYFQSRTSPGMPLQIMCYERADDLGFGVSGIVTRARALKKSFPGLDFTTIPMTQPVKKEKLVYLLDHQGASNRSTLLKAADLSLQVAGMGLPNYRQFALEIPVIPPFLHKKDGFIFSMGQLTQWLGSRLMGTGLVQIWPASPVKEALIEDNKIIGIRLSDQGVEKDGKPTDAFMPGMDVHSELTVIGDGPVGALGFQLDEHFGLPKGNHNREWAVGMKAVIDLPPGCRLRPGMVIHTLGYPEPEIFGFLYVHAGNIASAGIFMPSFLDSPVRSTYRYLQHWMKHPYLWQHLDGGTLRSWGAKTLRESGKRGEPFLVGNGYARIGESSGSTNVLTGSGVDEAWFSGVLLGEAVIELLKEKKPFTRENLDATYVSRRRKSWLEKEAKIAQHSRDSFQRGFLTGTIGMSLSGFSKGLINLKAAHKKPHQRVKRLADYYRGRIPEAELKTLREEARKQGKCLHDTLMDRVGWPQIEPDGKLLISHQDALLVGGKVQATAGFANHVRFLDPAQCEKCETQLCAEVCSAQAITPSEGAGVPQFDREKCIHCGACLWNCVREREKNPEFTNVDFQPGSGGLHSAEN